MAKKRALWLMNHTTLRNFEVPMLIDMGYEVYCPKIYQYQCGDLSASITYEYDETLSLSKEIIDILNKVDFYANVPENIKDIMNEYFDIVFFAFCAEQINMLTSSFKGILVLQAFGLILNTAYTDFFNLYLKSNIWSRLESIKYRFFFGQGYENLSEIECDLFKTRTIYLPLGLKNASVDKKWIGGDNRILFTLPRINTSEYFKEIYKKFKKDFIKFDYLVGGAQPIKVNNDKRVLGFIPQEQYEYNMTKLDVMFYHSQEPRHLHYHPLEAIKNGMPLIFMAGGMLDELGGKDLPGRCETIKEARAKIKKVFDRDQNFIKQVTSSQEILLRPFAYEYCRKKWDLAFKEIEKSYNISVENLRGNKPKKIAVILPAEYTGGVLDYSIRFIKSLHRGLMEEKNETQIVFGYKEHENFGGKDYFKQIEELGIQIRSFKWDFKTTSYVNNYFELKGMNIKYPEDKYCIMNDGIQNFNDCDYLIFTVDRIPATYFATRPYIVLAHDYIQRYLPNLYGNYYEKNVLEMQRNADKVFVTTMPTYNDAINYGGLTKDKLALTPLLFDKVQLPDINIKSEKKQDYFLWPTNVSEHKNHKLALQALSDYYIQGGKLKCYITGVNTDLFDLRENYTKKDYISSIRYIIKKDNELKKNLVFCGNMDKSKYLITLSKAKFLIHPGYADNGNGATVDAAFLGVPTISSDYPAMRYINEYMDLNIRFFNPFKSQQLTNLLLKTENDYCEFKKCLPNTAQLEKYSIKYTYKQLYTIVKNTIRF